MGLLESLDAGLGDLAGQWNIYSTGIVTVLIALVGYRVLTATEPDVHPMLLARQSLASPVRQEGESPVYRSQAAPHGMPLNSGLGVKDPGASKWTRGRDGDLRDVWRKAVAGSESGAKGQLWTVLGSQRKIEHKLEDITRQINLIGQHIAEQGGIRVAIYLPNSIELLVTLFACSFYPNLTTILIPFDVSKDELVSMLRRSAADTVVTAPGAFPFDTVVAAYPALRQLIWVVDEGSSHLDWNEVPEGTGGSVNVATWQDIVNDAPADAGRELPPLDSDPSKVPKDVVVFWQTKSGQIEEMVRFSQANLTDYLHSATSLANEHTLTLTLAALYSNASIALNSVAGKSTDLVLATQGIAPTVIVAAPETLLKSHKESASKLAGLGNLSHTLATRQLALDGVFSTSNAFSGFSAASRPTIGASSPSLRLIYVAERAGASTPHLSSQALSDLRIFTGARVIYALTAAKVAGAVAQTAFFDYRVDADGTGHFGAPLTSVEVRLRDSGALRTTDEKSEGEIIVNGPAVLGVNGRIRGDQTLAYA
uniref:AMP-dependent synthetase/ligase domain-containing protein n=1 Tax=Bionectria ochroleuca TaxID=29856 RepID=A0A0B7KFN1_BIOOC